MDELIRIFYKNEYPSDELGFELSEDVTFQDVWDLLEYEQDGGALYDLIGVGDSLVRERLFEELAIRKNCDYEDVYQAWLHGRNA